MIVQVLADWQFGNLLDVVFGKLGFWANAREHKELWCAKGTAADDDFLGGRQKLTVSEFNACSIAIFDMDTLNNGICHDVHAFKIVADGCMLTGRLMPILDQLSNAIGVTAIHVRVEFKARGQESFFYGLTKSIVPAARGSVYWAGEAMLRVIALFVVPMLGSFEEWE